MQDDACQSLCLWLNGPWYEFGTLYVYLTDVAERLDNPDVLKWSDTDIKAQVKAALLRSVFSSIPPTPIVARWSKMYASLQAFNPGFCAHGILIMAFSIAFDGSECNKILERGSAMHTSDLVPAPTPGGDAPHPDCPPAPHDAHAAAMTASADFDEDDIFGEDTGADAGHAPPPSRVDDADDFVDDGGVPCMSEVQETHHELDDADASRDAQAEQLRGRVRKVARGFRDPDTRWCVGALTTFIGPFNYLTAWFLSKMHLRFVNPRTLSTSIILDMAFAPASPILIMRQYFSAILLKPWSDGPLSFLGREDLTRPRINKLHLTTLAADGSLAHRCQWRLEDEWPTRALLLSDKRRSDHDAIRRDMCALHFCCPDAPYTGTILKLMERICGRTRSTEFLKSPLIMSTLR